MNVLVKKCVSPECSGTTFRVDESLQVHLCPQCGQLLVELTGDESITLTDFTTPVAGSPGPDPEPLDERGYDVAVMMAYRHFNTKTGFNGCVPFRIFNIGETPISEIHLVVNCGAFIDRDQQADESRRVLLMQDKFSEFENCCGQVQDRPGWYPVTISGYYRVEGEPIAFRGRFTLYISDKDETKAKVVFDDASSGDLQGIDMSQVGEFQVKDASAVMANFINKNPEGLRGDWKVIYLEYDVERTRLLREFGRAQATSETIRYSTRRSQPATCMTFLRVPEHGEQATFRIFTGKSWNLGRSVGESDLVTMLMPCSEENQARTSLISNAHCRLTVDERDRVMVEDLDSTNGTTVAGGAVDFSTPLNQGQLLGLANVMVLVYREFRDFTKVKEVDQQLNKSRTVVDFSTALASVNFDQLRDQAPLNCFCLNRTDSFRDKLGYLFLQRNCTIGSSPECVIRLDHDTVAEHHARIEMREGSLYVVDMASGKRSCLDGKFLIPGLPALLPLGRECEIQLGDASIFYKSQPVK